MTVAARTSTTIFDFLYVVFIRILALCFLVFALQYWLRLVGFYPGPDYQFDTMATHWKIAAAVLAVVQPVVALGLWGLFSWGIVVWMGTALIEIAMHSYFADLFGDNQNLILFHTITAAFVAMFLIVDRLMDKKT